MGGEQVGGEEEEEEDKRVERMMWIQQKTWRAEDVSVCVEWWSWECEGGEEGKNWVKWRCTWVWLWMRREKDQV